MAFEEAFSRAFNTSLQSTQQQLPRLLKMQQEMQERMDEATLKESSLNTVNAGVNELRGASAGGTAKTVDGMKGAAEIAEAYRQLAELPDHLRSDKQVVARTFREAAGFDPSENVITNVTKGDPRQLQIEADIMHEEVVNNLVTAGELRKMLQSSTASAASIAGNKDRKPGRINSGNQTEAQLILKRERDFLNGLNELNSKLAGSPGYKYMKPVLDAWRQSSMDEIAVAQKSFDMDTSIANLRLQIAKFNREGDLDLIAAKAAAKNTGGIIGTVEAAANLGVNPGKAARAATGVGEPEFINLIHGTDPAGNPPRQVVKGSPEHFEMMRQGYLRIGLGQGVTMEPIGLQVSTQARNEAAENLVKQSETLARAKSLMEDFFDKGEGVTGVSGWLAENVGGPLKQVNEWAGETFIVNLTGVSSEEVEDFRQQAKSMIDVLIPAYTGEEALTRVTDTEQKIARESAKLIAPGASGSQVKSAMRNILTLTLADQAKNRYIVGLPFEYDFNNPDKAVQKQALKAFGQELGALGESTDGIFEIYRRLSRIQKEMSKLDRAVLKKELEKRGTQ